MKGFLHFVFVPQIQEGIGRKIGDLIQYIAQVVASFAISFYLSWKLTIVLIAAIPAIGAAGNTILWPPSVP